MNRRRFLDLLASVTVTAGAAYSFPSIIVPKNLVVVPKLASVAGATESMWVYPVRYAIDLNALIRTIKEHGIIRV